ncbi:MAG: hypothetical protein R3245_09800, partial [Kiloniellales bacterium]|nr:hypothetical protein [Kiloniellales bacterium]
IDDLLEKEKPAVTEPPAEEKPDEGEPIAVRQVEPIQDIPDVLDRIRTEVPHFLAAMIVDSNSGMPIASLNDSDDLDIETAGAFYSQVVSSSRQAMIAIGKANGEVNPVSEILITSEDDYVLLASLRNGAHFLYLLMERDANPGLGRVVTQRYLRALNELLP